MHAVARHDRHRHAIVVEVEIDRGASGRQRFPETETIGADGPWRAAVDQPNCCKESTKQPGAITADEIGFRAAAAPAE